MILHDLSSPAHQKVPYRPQLRGRATRCPPRESPPSTPSPPSPPTPPTPPTPPITWPWRPARQKARLELASVDTSLRLVSSNWSNSGDNIIKLYTKALIYFQFLLLFIWWTFYFPILQFRTALCSILSEYSF